MPSKPLSILSSSRSHPMGRGLAVVLWLVATALLLQACGFQLRGEVNLPEQMRLLHLDMPDGGPPIRRELIEALQRGGVTVVDPGDGVAATAVLRLPVNIAYTEALTISEQARVREFAVRHRVVMEMRAADGSVLLPEQEILLERDFVFDQIDALGVAGQEEVLRRDLEREMVRSILRRIERVSVDR